MYPFLKIEKKWRTKWLKSRVYEPNLKKAKKPFYNLMMFPYPSAEGLHVGNAYAFTGSDIYGRFMRMKGHDVFEPIGLDGFGIHSENYALKIGKHPMKLAKITEKNFYRQLLSIGDGFAWGNRLETYDPDYYKWTQWIFLWLYKHGLAYRKKQSVNWCPSCKTVLADEQVIAGHCERCNSVVVKRELEQWFFKITKYAGRLLKNLDKIDWSERVKIAQRNWIGRSEGAMLTFKLKGLKDKIEVFTTRPDTLYGATYMVLAPEHELINKLRSHIRNWSAVSKYLLSARGKSEEERIKEGRVKTGVELKGIKAINPATKKEIPVWVADYVVSSYGTGAIMAVPAHDERDFEFAKKFKLPIRLVIEPETGTRLPNPDFRKSIVAIVENPKTRKFLTLNWGPKLGGRLFVGGGIERGEDAVGSALREIREEAGHINLKLVSKSESMHHHYFAFSKKVARETEVTGLYFQLKGMRQTSRDLKFDEAGNFKIEWVDKEKILSSVEDENHLLVFKRLVLGKVYTGDGRLMNSGKFNGLPSEKAKWEIAKFVKGNKKAQYKLRDWLISRQRYWGPPIPMIHCSKCGWQPVPEKDLPVKLPFVKQFRPTGKGKSPLASVKSFYEVKCPKCGGKARRETDVSDTFLDSAWYFFRYTSVNDKTCPWTPERARKWLPVSMYIGGAEHSVLHLLYSRFLTMVFKDTGLISHFEEPFTTFRAHGLLISGGAKMSKSKGNVVIPDEYVRKFGADTLRLYSMFLGPFEVGGDWRDQGIVGISRFLNRVWKFAERSFDKKGNLSPAVGNSIGKITDDVSNLRYNTAISELMVVLNRLESQNRVSLADFKTFLLMLAPFAPFISEELWEKTGGKYSVHLQSWPKEVGVSKKKEFELIFQVNGKMRGKVMAKTGVREAEATALAKAHKTVSQYLAGKKVRKVVFVPNKLINFVI